MKVAEDCLGVLFIIVLLVGLVIIRLYKWSSKDCLTSHGHVKEYYSETVGERSCSPTLLMLLAYYNLTVSVYDIAVHVFFSSSSVSCGEVLGAGLTEKVKYFNLL